MPADPDLPPLETLAALLATSVPGLADLRAEEIQAMREKGVAHAHFRLGGRGLVLRAPRLSQWALPPAENLAYQAACFRRAAPSGATPQLHAVLPVATLLPRGALVVEEIVGRPPRLPEDLPRLAESLARLHALPLPNPASRPPLADHGVAGPIAGTLAVIERQVDALDAPGVPTATRRALLDELAWARRLAAEAPAAAQPIALVGTDTHPGNFLVRQNGSAVLVDLEKALYGSPAIDLAHASLPTSTRWDLDVQANLSAEEIIGFYRHYLALLPPDAATMLRPWLLPCRRLTWLRTMLWFARWRVAAASSQDWSESRVDATLLAHIRRHIAASLAPGAVAEMRAEWLGGVLDL